MINLEFINSTNTLTIDGTGDLGWKDIFKYRDNTEYIVFKKDSDIFCSNASNLFCGFEKLKEITGELDTSMCKDFSYFYAECFLLTKSISNLDTSNGEEFDFFHSDNNSLEMIKFNSTKKGKKFHHMLYGCNSVKHVVGITINEETDINDISDLSHIVNLFRYDE
jgi:hypothetical protein